MPAVADTSFLVAVTTTTDPHHAAARAILQAAEPPAVNHATLSEFVQDRGFRAGKAGGARERRAAERTAVDLVLHTLGCPIEHVEDVAAAFGILTQQEHLSWVDALTVVQARGRDLWTFDKRQKAAHKKA